MKPTQLVSNTKKQEQLPNTYPHGKNGIWDVNLAAMQNERGFLPSSAQIPFTVIGSIETDTYPLVFSTNNTFSAIGFFNPDTDTYTPVINDQNLSYKLMFNLARPIKGEARRNFRNQIEIAWFEYGTGANPPRLLNTELLGTSLNDYLLFPQYLSPFMELTMQTGGNLGMGAYYIAAKYIKGDGTETRYTTLSAPAFAVTDNWNALPGNNTGASLRISMTGVDTRYERIQLVVIERLNGVDSAYELPELPTAVTMEFTYSGSEKQTQITLEEVLIPSAFYENVQAMTQLNDQLFLANLTEEDEVKLQRYASMAKIRWQSSLNYEPSAIRSGKRRGFMHEEVYCFYLVFKLMNGRSSKAFIIPGPAPISSDTEVSADAIQQGMMDGLNYKVTNTVRNINTANYSGDCGVWLNSDERYPDTVEFDSSAIGGPNLRGQVVRHHRMPSIRWCRQNLYSANPSYGRDKLDSLGLMLSNVTIPADLQGKVVGWELHYAKRDINNSTVLGQSMLMFPSMPANRTTIGNLSSTGGNWGSFADVEDFDPNTNEDTLKPVQEAFRFHAFDLLLAKPSVGSTYLSIQQAMTMNVNIAVGRNDGHQVQLIMDYMNPANNFPSGSQAVNHLRKVVDGQYVITNMNNGLFDNSRLEGAYVGRIPVSNNLLPFGDWQYMQRDYEDGDNTLATTEKTYLTNLMALRNNLYTSYYSQTLVRTGKVFTQNNADVIYGGDTFINEYSFITYGLVGTFDKYTEAGRKDYYKTSDTDGYKIIRRLICESVSNIAARYEIPGNLYSKFFPKTSIDSGNNDSFIGAFNRNGEPNIIGYNKEDNSVGDLLNGILIDSPFYQFVRKSPYKVTRTAKQVREGKVNSWKNFNALDYYETVKNKGEITNLQGMDDKLIIHHSNSFTITRDKAVLSTDVLNVTLGTGDIFQFEPQESRPTKLGYAGTVHPLACVLTPAGYIFPDAQTGELFLFNGKLMNLGMGVSNFLTKYMLTKDTNVYTGNGITIGFDQQHSRILLTVKNGQYSFTLSMRLNADTFEPEGWVFYHDYMPDFYLHTRKELYPIKSNKLYYMHKGPRGKYFDSTVHPFYIDILFSDKDTMLLNSLNWMTEVRAAGNDPMDDDKPAIYGETVTAITVWNNYQTTGRIALNKDVKGLSRANNRNDEENWSFNAIRDIVEAKGSTFIDNLFRDYAIDTAKLNPSMPWFNKQFMQGKYFIVRFEFDNNNDKQLTIYDVNADVSKSYR